MALRWTSGVAWSDGDELIRARALQFVRDWSDGAQLTTPRAIEVAERHASLFTNQTVEGETLRDLLADTLGVLAIRHEGARIAGILRKMAAVAPLGGGAVTILARHDPAFVIAQAKQWGGRASQWLADAATSIALYHRDSVIPFLQVASHLDEADRGRILGLVETVIKRSDADAALIARSNGTPVPPSQRRRRRSAAEPSRSTYDRYAAGFVMHDDSRADDAACRATRTRQRAG